MTTQNLQKTKIKAVIWDLDETLWDGTLAENEEIVPRKSILSLIARLDEKGIVNSICSKNEHNKAMGVLEDLDLWNYFVFPRIDFAPKGKNISQIVKELRLREENVLFVDDNLGNREEAIYYNPSILVADPNDEIFLSSIGKIIDRTDGVSRLSHYKLLENKSAASEKFDDNIDFLNDSDICINIIGNPEDLNYKDRIIELANRSNQLNFTNSRFTDNDFSAEFEVGDGSGYYHGVVFVRDKYGHYGLVGFFALGGDRKLRHFFFSCRILNMGVEAAVYRYLRDKRGADLLPAMEAKNDLLANIRIRHGVDQEVRAFLESSSGSQKVSKTSILAGCASGAIEHYLPEHLKPANFISMRLYDFFKIEDGDAIIYTAYSDYINRRWAKNWNHPYLIFSYRKFRNQLAGFLDLHREKKVYLVTSAEKFCKREVQNLEKNFVVALLKAIKRFLKRRIKVLSHGGRRRYSKCNKIVRKLAHDYPNVVVLNIDDFIRGDDELQDERHFKRCVFKRLSESLY